MLWNLLYHYQRIIIINSLITVIKISKIKANWLSIQWESPIYNQILQQEQIELHILGQLIQPHSGVVLDYNTDVVSCVSPGNAFPFELVEDIQLTTSEL